jgi:branched-chain amino acid transport system permease protein
MDFFGQLFVNAVMLGAIYSLTAVAYTLVYGVVQLVNFAFGELFMLGSFICVSLMLPSVALFGYMMVMPDLPIWLAAPIAVVVVAAIGVIVERLAYRPLRNAPRLAPLIVAIAVSVLLQSLAQSIWGSQELRFPSFPMAKLPPIVIFDAIYISVMEIVVLIVAVISMLGLTAFVKMSRLGRAMRATAEDRTAALLVGIHVNKVIATAFLIGSAFAAVAGILYAQNYGFAHPTMGFLPGLKALIAAVLGGIGSIPGAALGGMILAFIETFAAGYLPNGSAYRDAIGFAILVLLLMFRPQGLLGRKELNEDSSGSLIGHSAKKSNWGIFAALTRPIDVFLARMGNGSPILNVALLCIAIACAFLITNDYWLRILIFVVTYGLLASGLNIVVGFAGLLDLGFVAFWAVGSYFTSIIFILVLKNQYGVDPAEIWWLLYVNFVVGGVSAALLGLVLGYPTLRLRGDYLAIMTLGFGEIIRIVATNWIGLTRGPMGIRGIPPPSLFGIELGSPKYIYLLGIGLASILLVMISRMVRSYVGRAWVSIREDEHAAEAMGVPTARYKLLAYAFGGFIGGVVGVFFAHSQQYISPLSFTLFENILILMLIVMGGLGTFIGPFIGAFIWIVFLQLALDIPLIQTHPEIRFALLGFMLVILMIYRPQGIAARARVNLMMQ